MCASAIPKRFLNDYPNYLEHSKKAKKALDEAKEWFEVERKNQMEIIDCIQSAIEWYWRGTELILVKSTKEANVVRLTPIAGKQYDAEQVHKNYRDVLKFEDYVYKQDTKHLINLMKYRRDVSE